MKLKLAILSAFAVSASASPKITLGLGGGYARTGSTLKIDTAKLEKKAAATTGTTTTTTADATANNKNSSEAAGNGFGAGAFLEVGYEKSGIEFGLTGGVDFLFAKPEHKFDKKTVAAPTNAQQQGASSPAAAGTTAAEAVFNSGTGYLFGLGAYVGGSPMSKLSVKAGALVTFLKSNLNQDKEEYKIPVSIGVMPFARVSYAITSKIDTFLGFGWNLNLSKEYKTAADSTSKDAEAEAEKKKLNDLGVEEVKFGSTILVTGGVSFKLM